MPNEFTAAQARIRSILNDPLAARMRSLADHLAFDTSVDAEAARGIMMAFAADLDAAPTSSGGTYLDRKTAAGTLGLTSAYCDRDAAVAGWKKAADGANDRMGATAVH